MELVFLKWLKKRFCSEKEDFEDDDRPDHPIMSLTNENVETNR